MLIVQKTFKNKLPTIYCVGTPIGNLDDMSYRAIKTLKNVDFILCEDTRTSQAVLQKYKIDKPLLSLHKYNELERVDKLTELLNEGNNLAMISDAGMPTISDPGATVLNNLKWKNLVNFNISAVNAGPAYIHALAMSGFVSKTNFFYGFVENKNDISKAKELSALIQNHQDTLISFYESVHRIKDTIETLSHVLASTVQVTVTREITKLNEEVISGTISEVNKFIQSDEFIEKGEFVVVINNTNEDVAFTDDFILEKIEFYINQGLKIKAIQKIINDEYKVNKNHVYDLYLRTKQA